MNRRDMLKYSTATIASLSLPTLLEAKPTPVVPNKHKWFTHKQLMRIFKAVDGKSTRETVDMKELKHWNGEPLESWEAVYLGVMRMSNIMHVKTLDSQSEHWLVTSPSVCQRKPDVFPQYQFAEWSKTDKQWIRKHWRSYIKEEVSPHVYHMGWMNCRWKFYIDEYFPDNKIMLGMGYKEVIHHKYDMEAPIDEHGCHKIIAHLGPPTIKNYAVITLKY